MRGMSSGPTALSVQGALVLRANKCHPCQDDETRVYATQAFTIKARLANDSPELNVKIGNRGVGAQVPHQV
jgi:hypothetical protein